MDKSGNNGAPKTTLIDDFLIRKCPRKTSGLTCHPTRRSLSQRILLPDSPNAETASWNQIALTTKPSAKTVDQLGSKNQRSSTTLPVTTCTYSRLKLQIFHRHHVQTKLARVTNYTPRLPLSIVPSFVRLCTRDRQSSRPNRSQPVCPSPPLFTNSQNGSVNFMLKRKNLRAWSQAIAAMNLAKAQGSSTVPAF